MSEERKFTCSCGCGETALSWQWRKQGWLILKQAKLKGGEILPPNDPKLKKKLHFKSLDCLSRWVKNAVEDLPELQKFAESLSPHGTIRSKKARGLYI